MKAIALPLVLTLATAGMAAAHEPATRAYHKHSSGMSGKKASAARLQGEVVSTEGDKLVLKTSSGDETFTVKGKAAARLKNLKAGERIVVKARSNEVYAISAVKSKTKHHV